MIECRNASLPELETALAWAANEGWNPGLDDADAFFQTDPKGFFVSVDQYDAPAAFISVVNHTPDFAFLGLYIVRPDLRGQGIGLKLWEHALHHAGPRTVGLDGVEAQQDNYRASGFTYFGATTRYTGQLRGDSQQNVHPIDAGQIPMAVHMEAAASGVAKPDYLRPWLTGTSTRTTFVYRDQSTVQGFCTIRACQSGAKIGPLVAEGTGVARSLITHAAATVEGQISIDVPHTATDLAALCQSLGLAPGFTTARMYHGAFAAPKHTCFAVTSLELG